uniref:Uncharacterized protein n=1 Tax=viral metagenome TaxID=1070528 RepID=A0A6M3IGG3_9ZZZZ
MVEKIKKQDLAEYLSVTDFREFPSGVDLTSTPDEQIESCFTMLGDVVQDYVSKPFLTQIWTDRRKGNGTNKFNTTYDPVKIISIKEQVDYNTTNEIAISSTRWCPEGRVIEASLNYFYPDYTYEVKYTMGSQQLPRKVKQAIFLAVANYLNSLDYMGMKAIKIDTIQVWLGSNKDPLPDMAKALLSEWVEDMGVI